MTGYLLPIDADTTSQLPVFTAKQNRVTDGVLLGAVPGRPLAGRSGLRLGGEPTVTVTSTTWTVTPFLCAVDPGTALDVGTYRAAFAANETGTVTAADASNQRVDILYVQVPDDPAPAGSAARVATLGYTPGIPGAAGGAIGAAGGRPATPVRSFLLGTITVPKVGSGSPTFTPVWPYTAGPGDPIPVRNQAERDAIASPYTNMKVERLDLNGGVERYNGTAWEGWITPTLLSSWGATGSGYQAPRYKRMSGVVWLQGLMGGGSLSTAVFVLPAGYRPSAILTFNVPANGGAGTLRFDVYPTGEVTSIIYGTGASNGYASLAGIQFPADQ